jgi:hypothetical protein
MRTLRFLPAAAVVLLAACGSNSTSPSATVDVNALVNQMSTGGGASYSSAALAVSVPGSSTAASVPSSAISSCPYSSADQRFECAPVTTNGLTITRSFALLDASNQPLSTLDPTAVVAIRTITDVKGALPASALGTVTINRHDDETLSGIRTSIHTMNGTSTQQTTIVMNSITYSSNETGTTSNLQLPLPTATSPWPTSGTITTDRTITVTPGLTVTSHEVLTFDGTSIVTLTRTSAGSTMTCAIDLSGRILPVCS